MRKENSRNLVLWLFFLVLVHGLCFPVRAQADSTNVPWLTGIFGGSGPLFSVSDTWQDYQWYLEFSPNLPDMTITWWCSDFYCEGGGGGQMTGGPGYGAIWSSSSGDLLYTFTGQIYSGWVSIEAGHCVDLNECRSYTYDQYWFDFRGLWSNGWYTAGNVYANDFDSSWNGTSESRQFIWLEMTTSTPEPATLTLVSLGLAGVYVRVRGRH